MTDNIIVTNENQPFNKNEKIKEFTAWMKTLLLPPKNLPLRPGTMEHYKSYIPKIEEDLLKLKFITDPYEFYSGNSQVLKKIKEKWLSDSEINERNENSNRAHSSAFKKFIEFQESLEKKAAIKEDEISRVDRKEPYQKIIYGAPGTGKSHSLKNEVDSMFQDIIIENERIKTQERTTFYDGYTYGQFVGAYKPITIIDKSKEEKDISYDYVPGPLFRQLVKAFNDSKHNFVLIIEEINRARADRVFGSIFQLLDRDNTGKSEYPVSLSEEQERYFRDNLSDSIYSQTIEKNGGLYLPNNFYIWATMNSADQGVYPMDSAFKRRWNFQYIKLDENAEAFGEKDCKYLIQLYIKKEKDENGIPIIQYSEWKNLRKAINNALLDKVGVPEDRLIAPFFVKPENFDNKDMENEKHFRIDNEIYKSKILMYLFDDILRHHGRDEIFSNNLKSFSKLIEEYENGENIFNKNIFNEISKIDNKDGD